MNTVGEHYENLLARYYTWMRGDYDAVVREARISFEQSGISPRSGGRALDLGCGPGFHSVALAELGFEVLGVDTSNTLLEELRRRAGTRAIRSVLGDIRDPDMYAGEGPFEVAICMGDTLTHLETSGEVEALVGDVRNTLERSGMLILEFRDYAMDLEGVDRIIPVKMDDDRIMTTFLEYETDRVNVHDVVFQRDAGGWKISKSAYPKLRLGGEQVVRLLERAGLRVVAREDGRGFIRIVAQT